MSWWTTSKPIPSAAAKSASAARVAATYQQAGGQGNNGISPQTHQLVDLALNGGGSGGSGGGLGLAGLGGGQKFPQMMGMNPNFGGMMAA